MSTEAEGHIWKPSPSERDTLKHFAIVLPSCDDPKAAKLARRMDRLVARGKRPQRVEWATIRGFLDQHQTPEQRAAMLPPNFIANPTSMADIDASATERGGFTRVMFEAWGLGWPAKGGWKDKLIKANRGTANVD